MHNDRGQPGTPRTAFICNSLGRPRSEFRPGTAGDTVTACCGPLRLSPRKQRAWPTWWPWSSLTRAQRSPRGRGPGPGPAPGSGGNRLHLRTRADLVARVPGLRLWTWTEPGGALGVEVLGLCPAPVGGVGLGLELPRAPVAKPQCNAHDGAPVATLAKRPGPGDGARPPRPAGANRGEGVPRGTPPDLVAVVSGLRL